MDNKRTELIILIILTAFCLIFNIIQGQDNGWDLANYHYNTVWSLFNEKIGYDIMPSGIQSYFNPVPDIPLYLLVKYFNNYPIIIETGLCISWIISTYFIYKISELIFIGKKHILYTIIAVLIGMSGTLSMFALGLNSSDFMVCAFCLTALYIYLRKYRYPDAIKKYQIGRAHV